MSHGAHRSTAAASRSRKVLAGLLSLTVSATGAVLLAGASAQAASVTSAVFSGGAGTATVGGTLYAKQGAALTLTVVTSNDTKCVAVTGAATLPRQTSTTAKSNWTFTTTAPVGNGAQAFTVAASPDYNNNNCTGKTETSQASYVVDNTGPVVSAALTPAANAAGWNNSDVTVRWTATDTGSGVAAAQPFKTDSVSGNGITNLTVPAQSDRLDNSGASGAVTVRVDKAKPSISATQTKNADGTTTITFTCGDSNSGGGEASGIASCVADGSTSNSRTVQPGVTVTGTATDRAGNTATASSTAPAGDTTAPLLSGSPTTQPNTNGWYRDDVTIDWTASDPESGIPSPPTDTTITGEGAGLTSTTSVRNGAGLGTTATSSPAVNIDRTAPTTGIGGTSNGWVNENVTLTLSATDNLSDTSTTYSVDGGAPQTGTSVSLSTNGEHTVTFFSTDEAGNVEKTQTAIVRIDQTAPTISHSFQPLSYTDGAWTNQNVTVTFTCADQGGSGVAGCTAPVTKSAEGEYTVTGTATDGAGNTSTDNASVRIDKTAPTITATAGGTKNDAGWYKEDVTVTYSASDTGGSGIAGSLPNDVLGEGANQSASATVTDAAGNSASAGVTGINVDKTPPTLNGSFPSGWHTDDVTVNWTCTDGLSGPLAQPADTVVDGEGDNLSATASCTDVAGNTTTKTVSGIQIDRHAPTTQAKPSGSLVGGWYNADVEVTLTGADNLSGIAATYYTVDSGAQQTYSGPLNIGEGTHTVTFWSKDGAGNVEKAGPPLVVNVDKTAPETEVINPISPDSGWFVTSGIPVAFKATDVGSGVAATYYTIDGGPTQTYGDPFTATLTEGSHTITYWSVDLAGNDEAKATTRTVTVQVDTLDPVVSPDDVTDTTWRNTPLSQAFTAGDGDGSGLKVPADASFTLVASDESTTDANGVVVPTTVSKTVTDVAGNTTTRTLSALIDVTAPTGVAFTGGPAAGTRYYSSTVPAAPSCSAGDGLSGLRGCTVSGYSTAEGTHTLTATATDNAGNTATATRTYTVRNLTRTGFFAPVDMNGVQNTIKGGNTVPLKFRVFDGTTQVTDRAVVASFVVTKTSCTVTATQDAVEVFATAGQTELRYDATGAQFIQNWKTPTGSGCYKVTMTTVDGQTLTALFKTLR